MNRFAASCPILFLVAFSLARPVWADAVIAPQAMTATTIAEFFVGDGVIRVELEIGASHLPAFRDARRSVERGAGSSRVLGGSVHDSACRISGRALHGLRLPMVG